MKEKNVIEFYVLCNKLKNVIRTGWLNWNVERERIESVAEHIYGTQMLAIAMWSEFDYKIDIMKVLTMLAVHELEEIKIGDLTIFDIDRKTKQEMGHKAVEEILKPLLKNMSIKDWVLEFDERKTPESQFAYHCDKLEADIQCKLYDEEGCVDLGKHVSLEGEYEGYVKKVLEEEKSWSKMWIRFGQEKYDYDNNFLKVSRYVKDTPINKFKS